MKVTRRSPLTGKVNEMDLPVTHLDFNKWYNGALIQDAFPHLTPSEREFIKCGYTEEDWRAMFPPENDENT